MWRLILSLGVLLRISTAWALPPEIPAPPTQWVTDQVGYLSEAALQDLNFRLENYESESGHQVLVYLTHSTAQVPLEDWTARAFEAWGVGQKSLNDGLVLFVFVDDKRARIEVGYGLEAVVPDVVAARMIREELVPRLLANDYDGAISETTNRLILAIDGEAQTTQAPPKATLSPWQMISGGLLLIAFVLLLIFKPSWALFLLYVFLRRGGGGGGGFSGGGGRSGGGGASGGW
jgi:uncharacterized protein